MPAITEDANLKLGGQDIKEDNAVKPIWEIASQNGNKYQETCQKNLTCIKVFQETNETSFCGYWLLGGFT